MSHHEAHSHVHGANCGHRAIRHGDHLDYLHDGHLHFAGASGIEEHRIEVSQRNPDGCVSGRCRSRHDDQSSARSPHGDHWDYLIDGRLHHPHGDHCDDHGLVDLA
jgi:hypothetical protein